MLNGQPKPQRNVAKAIELRHNKLLFIGNKKNMASKDELRSIRRISPQVTANPEMEFPLDNNDVITNYNTTDIDIVICITSYDRYDKSRRLIKQFYDQPTRYKFKFIFLNDGSSDSRYDDLPNEFENFFYIKNDRPNGKIKHWYSYSQMWEILKGLNTRTVLELDDDFILCENFLDIIYELYLQEKRKSDKMFGIAPHLWSFNPISILENWWNGNNFIDGIALLDVEIIKKMNYEMVSPEINSLLRVETGARTWSQITSMVNKLGGFYYRTPISLVYHDGNEDSKLHPIHRSNGKNYVYTQRFVGKII